MTNTNACPCHSQKAYSHCCQPFHEQKQAPKTALELMRSRYSAYALGLVDYIIDTTHPSNPLFLKTRSQIKKEIAHFCKSTKFEGLEIKEFIDGSDTAYVTFIAHLKQGQHNATFQEKSSFKKCNGRWLYESAVEWR